MYETPLKLLFIESINNYHVQNDINVHCKMTQGKRASEGKN